MVKMKKKPEANQSREIVINLLLVFAVGWLVVKYQLLIGPLIISGLVAYLLYPFVTRLSKRTRINRRRIVMIVYLVFLVLLIWAILVLFPQVISQASLIENEISKFQNQVQDIQHDLKDALGFEIPLDAYLEEFETDLDQLLRPERAFRIIRNATTNIVWVLVIIVTSFHLLRDWEKLREAVFGLFPEPNQSEYRRLHQEIKKVWNSYLRGQVMVMFFIGLLSGFGAALIGLPSALLLGFLAGALALIPNLGPATATIIAAVVAWTQGSVHLPTNNLTVTILIVAWFGLVQAVEGFWLTPRVMSRRVNIHPGIVMVSIVGTLFTLGALIALIIIPIIASMVLVISYLRRKRAGLDPWPVEDPIEVGGG
jgi:predicted PurR-regulated permease PerM